MASENQMQIRNKATVEDKDVSELEIRITLKPGVTSKDCSPFTMERVVLEHMARSFPVWAEYWMKPGSTLG